MNVRSTALAAALLFCAAFAARADELAVKGLKYSKALVPVDEKTVPSAPGVFAFELDSQMYEALQTGCPDLRVVFGRKEIPFAIHRVEGASVKMKRQVECPSKLVSFAKAPDNRVEMVLERVPGQPGSELPASSLVLSTRSKNFEKRVRVQAGPGPDGPWIDLIDETPIFDYSDFIEFSRKSVQFPENPSPFIKLTISNYAEDSQSPVEGIVREFRGGARVAEYRQTLRLSKSLKLDAVSLLASQEVVAEVPELLREYPTSSFSTREAGQETIVSVGSKREPLRSLTLETASSFFMRRVMIECAEDVSSEWRPLASCAIYSIGSGPARNSSLSIEFPETRAGLYRVRISNGDAPSLKISGVVAKGSVYQVEFIAGPEAAKGLKALYGAELARKPVYDAEEVLSKMKKSSVCELKAGPQEANAFYTGNDRKIEIDAKTALYVAAALAALLLGFLVYKGAKNVDKRDEEKP